MLNLVWLRSMLAVVEHGSFHAAAAALNMAQPTVSQHVQKLEDTLRVVLIQRSRLGCQPTPEALRLLPYARSLLRLNQRAAEAVKRQQWRIGASSNIGIYLLPPYLQGYLKDKAPNSLDVLIDCNPAIADKLENGEIDIAIMEWWDERNDFIAQLWRSEPLVVIAAHGHPLSTRPFISREELAGLALLGGEPGSGTGRLLRRYLGPTLTPPSNARQLGSTEAVKRAVQAGLGISLVLEASVRAEVAAGTLRVIPLAEPAPKKDLHLIWRPMSFGGEAPPPFVSHLLRSLTIYA